MSQYIDHVFVMTGDEAALDAVLTKLENLKKKYPSENGVMEWKELERTDGLVEFYLMDSHYFEAKELTPRLIKWGESAGIVIQRYSWTDDGECAAWAVRIEDGDANEIDDWAWPHSASTQIELLSFNESPSPEKAVELVKLMSKSLEPYDNIASGVGIAEFLLTAFEEFPELLEDANVQRAIRGVEEHDWSEDDIEDSLVFNSIDDLEPLFEFYRLRETVMIRQVLPPGVATEIHTP